MPTHAGSPRTDQGRPSRRSRALAGFLLALLHAAPLAPEAHRMLFSPTLARYDQ